MAIIFDSMFARAFSDKSPIKNEVTANPLFNETVTDSTSDSLNASADVVITADPDPLIPPSPLDDVIVPDNDAGLKSSEVISDPDILYPKEAPFHTFLVVNCNVIDPPSCTPG